MTKSQNTKNEQQKDLCITSEQLTEKWKKRTLRNGAYYIKTLGGDILPAFCNTEYILKQFQTMKGIYDDVAEVLAPVPTFEEWQAKLEDNKRLKHDVGNLGYKIKNQRHEIDNRLKEIDKLKDALKDCQEKILLMDYDNIKIEILQKIDEALK